MEDQYYLKYLKYKKKYIALKTLKGGACDVDSSLETRVSTFISKLNELKPDIASFENETQYFKDLKPVSFLGSMSYINYNTYNNLPTGISILDGILAKLKEIAIPNLKIPGNKDCNIDQVAIIEKIKKIDKLYKKISEIVKLMMDIIKQQKHIIIATQLATKLYPYYYGDLKDLPSNQWSEESTKILKDLRPSHDQISNIIQPLSQKIDELKVIVVSIQ
jgi:hypothetical protein